MKIHDIHAREIFDSRGVPTVECNLFLSNGVMISASVPAGISRSTHEAVELRDGGERLMGMGVHQAISVIDTIIAPTLIGRAPDLIASDLEMLDREQNNDKSYCGANAILAVSLAVCRAQAYVEGLELYEFIAHIANYSTVAMPCPMFNFLEGGLHAENNFPIQELLIVPTQAASFHDAMEVGVSTFYALQEILRLQGKITAAGYEGGFVPSFANAYQACDTLMEAINRAGTGDSVMISLDMAASHLYNNETKLYNFFGKQISSYELIEWYKGLIKQYPIYGIEDGLDESDWNGWQYMNDEIGALVQLIGDDLFATDPQRIWHGIETESATAAIIKPNQIGTVTETLQAVQLCKENDWEVVVSHRSGETNDSFIADLAVAVSAGHIKAGGCRNGERMAKYNRLLEIEDILMKK